MKKWNSSTIQATKGKRRLATLTAYDFLSARLADAAGLELLLVGDSLGMTMLGYKTTVPVTMEEVLHHTRAVTRAVTNAMVVADMPFLSYQISDREAMRNAGRFLQEAGAEAVKIEGGTYRAELVKLMVQNGIPVLGHIGLTPQSVNVTGGYKVQGKTREACDKLIEDALALTQAGVFALVRECTPPEIGAAVTAAVPVPVISVGAGPACDGQMLVMHDMLGITERPARFVKQYASVGAMMSTAFAAYAADVRAGHFPSHEHCYAAAITPTGE